MASDASQLLLGSIFILIYLASFYWRWTRSRFVRLIDALPGRKGLPVLGNLLDFAHIKDAEGVFMALFREPRRYGDICRIWLGNQAVILITSPELIKPVLSNRKLVTKSKEYNFFNFVSGEGLFDSAGERWKNRRNLLNPAFHLKNINDTYLNVFNKIGLHYKNKIEKTIMSNQVTQIDVSEIIANLTMDSILESLMGHTTPHNYKERVKVAHALERADDYLARRIINPFLSIDSIFWLTPLGRYTKKCLETINNFTGQVIHHRRRFLDENEMKESGILNRNDNDYKKGKSSLLLDILLNTSESDTNKLTEHEIQGEINAFLHAGVGTTASAITWLLYCLARHPEEQDMVLNEQDQVFSNDKNRPCTIQDVSELKYLECCIKETLRIYPSIPYVARHLTEDVVVGNNTLPAGATAVLSIYGMHHNPKVFSDPDVFKPKRFLPEYSEGRHPYAFIPFGGGPRNCIGSKYAMVQMKKVLSHLLRNFRFESLEDPSQPLRKPQSSLIVIRPRKEVNLIVKQRGQ